MRSLYFVFLFLISSITLQAQNANSISDMQISIITIGPGSSLNDAFGHNGFRVKTSRFDVVYDYGRFPFDDPNFYLNFARGKLLYSQGFSNYYDVLNFYKHQNRTIREQVLNLSIQEKININNYLINNALPENKDYLYDFFYDNCATKIRDVAEEIADDNIIFNTPKDLKEKSFRDLIQENLQWNSWGSLGIDIALGSVIDKNATAYEYMFLPEYIFQFFDIATRQESKENLVSTTRTIYDKSESKTSHNFLLSPFFILGLLGILIMYLTYVDNKKGKRTKSLDITIFGITGLIGLGILLLWFATDHTTTAQNYNLLWAFGLNIIVIGQVFSNTPRSWFVKYLKFLVIMLCLMVFHWVIGAQRFALALLPLLIPICIRYLYLIRFFLKRN